MLRILILDDEPLVAMMMEDWLVELGFEPVGPANSVSSALELLNSTPVDAAILDVSLGAGGNSYEVAEALTGRNIPFAFATGHGSADVDPRFKQAAVLGKPFDFDAVKTLLVKLSNGRVV